MHAVVGARKQEIKTPLKLSRAEIGEAEGTEQQTSRHTAAAEKENPRLILKRIRMIECSAHIAGTESERAANRR